LPFGRITRISSSRRKAASDVTITPERQITPLDEMRGRPRIVTTEAAADAAADESALEKSERTVAMMTSV